MKPSDMNQEKKASLETLGSRLVGSYFQPLDEIYAYYGAKIGIYFVSLKCIRSGYFSLLHLGFACNRLALDLCSFTTSLFLYMHSFMGNLLFSILEAKKLYSFDQFQPLLVPYGVAWRERCSYWSLLEAMSISLRR
ncbi:hypothetical protein Hdeb2414_s0057g00758751 [Helianthus debilis subsp. tardiflorus]